MDSKEKEEYRKALEHVKQLYPSAHVLAKAQLIIRHENEKVRIGELTDLLRQDASIATDVVRASNSVHYGFASPSSDLETSINRIGLEELLKLVGFVIARNVFSRDLEHYNMTAIDHWTESVVSALMMEWLSAQAGLNSHEAYMVGLLSVVGKTVINEAFDMFGDEYSYDGSLGVREWEMNLLSFDYAQAASVLMKRWEFPVDIIAPIKYQYQSDEDPENSCYTPAIAFVREWLNLSGLDLKVCSREFSDSAKAFLSASSIPEEECVSGLDQVREKLQSMQAM